MKPALKNQTETAPVIFPSAGYFSSQALAASPVTPPQPAGEPPIAGLAHPRTQSLSRRLGPSAGEIEARPVISGTGAVLEASHGVYWTRTLQADAPLYSVACGGGLWVFGPG